MPMRPGGGGCCQASNFKGGFYQIGSTTQGQCVSSQEPRGIMRSQLGSSYNLGGISGCEPEITLKLHRNCRDGMLLLLLLRYGQLYPHLQCQPRTWGPRFTNEVRILSITLIQGLSVCMCLLCQVQQPTFGSHRSCQDQWFSCYGSRPIWGLYDPFTGVACQGSCKSDIYILIHNSRKVTVMNYQ